MSSSLAPESIAPGQIAADCDDVRAAREGDQQAFGRIVERYQGMIAAQLWRYTRQRSDYEELIQNVFVEAYFGLPKFRGEAPLLHWLRKIATRVGYRHLKDVARRRRFVSLTQENCRQLQQLETQDQEVENPGELLHTLLARLAPRDRLVLTLLYLEQCTVAEAAELAGWSQTMIKVQAYRARKRLKKLFAGVLT